MYKIEECTGEEVIGSFYGPELSLVTESKSTLYRVDKYLDEKMENGQKYVLVQFQGYPAQCSEWVLKSSIRNVK